MSRKRVYYESEFKRAVVSEVALEGRSCAEVARRHNLPNPQLVSRWVQESRDGVGWAREGTGAEPDLRQQNHRLERENKRLRQEVEILKKASAYFARSVK